jgi:3-hydroxybutyryl-CoA dehydrogenase
MNGEHVVPVTVPQRLGVIGAGTMGAGIAQVAAQAGLSVMLYDVADAALATGLGRVRAGLERLAAKRRITPAELESTLGRIQATTDLARMSEVDLVIEAAPESLALKRELFGQLDQICPAHVILATNTSALAVTEIAAATGRPDRVVGLHFFNPVPLMALVEVVRAPRTSPETVATAVALAERLGKRPIPTKDSPGFIVNRIARPFPGEALRLVGEGVATPAQIDRIARAVGFRMGPFELMDLVGLDVNFAVNRAVWDQYFGEPRFRPHPLQAQMVQAGLLGRKTGQGWYRYQQDQVIDGPAPPQYFGAPAPRPSGLERVWIQGSALWPTAGSHPGPLPAGYMDPTGRSAWMEAVGSAGYYLVAQSQEADVVILTDPFGLTAAAGWTGLRTGALLLWDGSACTESFLAPHLPLTEAVSFSGLPILSERQLVELGTTLVTRPEAVHLAVAFCHSLGRDAEVVQAVPGLVALRLIACLVNEACWALMEGIADPAQIDTAMQLGVNYPHGPLAWSDQLGPGRILMTLEALHRFMGDDRYRPAPLLRRLVAAGGRFHGA